MSNVVQIRIIFRRLQLPKDNNSGVVNSCDKVTGFGSKNIADGSKRILILALFGLYKGKRHVSQL